MKDTLDTLSRSSGQVDNLILIIAIIIVVVVLLLWLLIRDKKSLKEEIITQSSPVNLVKTTSLPVNPAVEVKQITRPIITGTAKVTEQLKPSNEKIVYTPLVVASPDPPPEPSRPKYIGYKPINIFEQTEPLKFPYVIMPKENCVIKFPQKGRSGRKGYKEDDFKTYLSKYFRESFQLFDDRFILIKGSDKPYEPDFTLTDEKQGINIFLDVEIDEPYEGINDIDKRKATHFRQIDTNRNNAFKNRGWIIIRFAEIQVHQNPNGCCLFIADVMASINTKFIIPSLLTSANQVKTLPQWTKEEAEQMSRDKYREKYLGIDRFGVVEETLTATGVETELGEKTEEIVKDEVLIIIPPSIRTQFQVNPTHDLIRTAISNRKFISFSYNGNQTIVQPNFIKAGTLNAYCYIKNENKDFTLANILNPIIKQRPFTLEATGPNLGLDRIVAAVNTAIQYQKFIRMSYTRSAWTSMQVDEETGEILYDVTEAEESIRTISNVQLSINALDQEHLTRYNLNENYITAYCHRREEKRTFKFDRISELAILDL